MDGVAAQARQLPGCHDLVQSADPIDPERINIFERWDSDEVLMAFRNSGPEGDEPAPVPTVLGAEIAKYRISAVEGP